MDFFEASAAPQVLGDKAINVPAGPKAKAKAKTVEEQYTKMTLTEHILKRPDSYLGSVKKQTEELDIYTDRGFEHRKITYVPGLYKLFDEVLSNASDHRQRHPELVTEIKINIDKSIGEIKVYNNGPGIPVEMHEEHKIWVPELIFSHLLAGSNFDDSEERTTGGRNGYGAKLTNIYSKSFKVDTASRASKKIYSKEWTEHMSKSSEAVIKPNTNKDDWTCITFRPDLALFGMDALDDDIIGLMRCRIVEMAGTVGRKTTVWFNDEKIAINTFEKYARAVLQDAEIKIYRTTQPWEIVVSASQDANRSFVNGIATKGGKHVTKVCDAIADALMPAISKKKKKMEITAAFVKKYFSVFINCTLVNPTFGSQTKEVLTGWHGYSGDFKCVFPDAFVKELANSEIVDKIIAAAERTTIAQISKAVSGKKNARVTIPKLEDANEAGTRNSEKCTLILTEGDSAKALAISGLSVVGRDYYGVFPLRGKLLNVREASAKQIAENAEVKAICTILGLDTKLHYTDTKKFRYGRVMIMTDQDQDGSHIKGLLINFIHHFWPELLTFNTFLVEFITPIVKVRSGKQEKTFFTIPQYQEWAKERGDDLKRWTIKYYKGLGTSTPKEAKEYFSDMAQHMKSFEHVDEEDDKAIELCFSKTKVEDRKEWLRGFKPGTFLDHSVDKIRYADFINKEMILFSMMDNERSIPSLVDGFKPGQRKVLFAVFKRNLKQELKVAQLAGYVAEHSSYHHGEVSLGGTIVGMAQNYVGSNNISLLEPIGQFGTRLQGGKDAASTRYIFTKMSPLARVCFSPHDDQLLSYLNDDGQSIEPKWYIPVLPMVLVNGSDGIGTGWSSSIPTYNPANIIANIRSKLNDRSYEFQSMTPWYKGFTGQVVPKETKGNKLSFAIIGTIQKVDDTTVDITELPVRKWTQDYKEFLEGLVETKEKTKETKESKENAQAVVKDKQSITIKDYKEFHTDTTVHFRVSMSPEQMAVAEEMGLVKAFKLETSVSTSNMMLFDSEGRMKKYDRVEDILAEFYDLRLEYYRLRKDHMLDCLGKDYDKLYNKVRFIMAVIKEELNIRNRKKTELLAELREKKYKPFPKVTKAASKSDAEDGENEDAAEDATDDAAVKASASDYDYLLSMPMWSLTLEKVEKLKAELKAKEQELNDLSSKTREALWLDDLDQLEVALEEQSRIDAHEEAESKRMSRKSGKKKTSKKNLMDDDDDEDDDEQEWQPKAKKKPAAAAAKPAAPKPVAKVAAPAAAAPAIIKPSAAAEDTMSLAERLASKAPANARKRPLDDGGEDDDADYFAASAAAPAKKPKKVAAAAASSSVTAAAAVVVADKENQPKAAATRPKKQKAKKIVSDDEDEDEDEDFMFEDDDNSDSDFEAAPKKAKKPAAPKKKAAPGAPAPVPARPKTKKAAEAFSDEDDSADFVPSPPPQKKKVTKPIKIHDDDDAEDDDFKPSPPPQAKKMKKSIDSDEEDFEPKPKKAAAAAKPKAASKPKKTATDDDDIVSAPAAKKVAAAKKPAAAPRKRKAASPDFDMDEEPAAAARGDEDDEDIVRPKRARRAAAVKVQQYFDGEDGSDVELFGDDGKDSDFNLDDEESD